MKLKVLALSIALAAGMFAANAQTAYKGNDVFVGIGGGIAYVYQYTLEVRYVTQTGYDATVGYRPRPPVKLRALYVHKYAVRTLRYRGLAVYLIRPYCVFKRIAKTYTIDIQDAYGVVVFTPFTFNYQLHLQT